MCECSLSITQFFGGLLQVLSQPKSEVSLPDGLLAVPLLRHQVIFLVQSFNVWDRVSSSKILWCACLLCSIFQAKVDQGLDVFALSLAFNFHDLSNNWMYHIINYAMAYCCYWLLWTCYLQRCGRCHYVQSSCHLFWLNSLTDCSLIFSSYNRTNPISHGYKLFRKEN